MQSEQFHEFVIIGAGISGLQAAMILSEHQKDFIILEATSVIGGRIGTQTLGQVLQKQSNNPSFGIYQNQPSWVNSNLGVLNVPIQYGATWVAQSHSYMRKLIKSLQLEIFPQHKEGLYIYGSKPGKYDSLKTYTQLYDKQTRQQVSTLLNKIEKLKNKFSKLYQQAIQKQYKDKLQPYQNFVSKYDSISVRDFIREQLNDDELASQLMNFIQCLQCISCDKFSMMQLIDDSDSLAIVQQTVQDQGQSDDGYRIKTGTLSIIRGMFDKIIKNVSRYKQNVNYYDIFRFNQPVAKIESWENKNNKQCRVHVRGPNGTKVYKTKRILNSIPLATLNKVEITNLSRGQNILFNGQQLGNVHRVYMVFSQPFWRGKFNGYGSFGPNFPFNQMTDITPENNKCGVLVFVFYVDKYHRWVHQYPDASQRFTFLKNVVADMMLKGDRNSEYLEDCFTYVRSFENHQYIRASYQPTTKMGVWKAIQQAGDQYGQTFERDQNGVYFIGSQFDENYGSYMQGGLRVTRKKVFQLLSIPDPWKN